SAGLMSRTGRTSDATWMAIAEQAREGSQVVVPIVIAGQREKDATAQRAVSGFSFVGVLEGRCQLGLVVLRGGGRIDFVAAGHQDVAFQQGAARRLALRTWRRTKLAAREQARDRMGRPPAIAGIGAIVEPEIAVGGLVRRRRKIEVAVEIGAVEWIERGDE